MKRRILPLAFAITLVCLLFAICGCSAVSAYSEISDCSETRGKSESCLAAIYYDGIFLGSATKMNGGYLVTAAHIIPEKYDGRDVCLNCHIDGSAYGGRVIYIERENDLALIDCDNIGGGLITAERPQKNPTAKTLFGEKTLTLKKVRSTVPGKPKILYEAEAEFRKGTSGSPVISKSGTLTGIICARSLDKKKAYIIGCDEIKKFLTRSKVEIGK